MKQDSIINHGMLIDTYNYTAMINAMANSTNNSSFYQVKASKKSKVYKNLGIKKNKKNTNRKMLKR